MAKSHDYNEKLEYVRALERKLYLKENLPHLHGWKWYPWAWEFFKSENRMNFLCAANQISKSSTQIRKCIDWATNPDEWSRWPTPPRQFWYFYPTMDVATIEWRTKWVKEFMPKAEFKDHAQYGWDEELGTGKKIKAIHFKSGVSVYFKSYEMDASALQTASVHAMFCDEELPVHLYDELLLRMASASVQGHFHMVFTATIGQEFWREVIEEKGQAEKLATAFKRQVSMYDCLEYMDGTPSSWTKQLIDDVKARCKSEAEILRRVYGRFVLDADLKYEGFSRTRNVKPDHKLPPNWLVYSGVDIGSGGSKSHPAAIVFVGVKPDFTEGRVFLGWRGDGVETTAADILQKYRILRGPMKPVLQSYDWAAKDFFTIASRIGESFQPAEKSTEIGEQTLNSLFKNGMLSIYESYELMKLVNELMSLKRSTHKQHAKDDMVDALRYAVAKVPWDFSYIAGRGKVAPQKPEEMEPRMRHYKGLDLEKDDDGLDFIVQELEEANDYYDFDQD